MLREIIKINDELCYGCGACIPNCHEGALQIIDGKVRLVSELMCDGLGACIGHCPTEAITIEKREALSYDEVAVIKEMVSKGKNTIVAHLKHLKEHNESIYLKEGIDFMKANEKQIGFGVNEAIKEVLQLEHTSGQEVEFNNSSPYGCPGSKEMHFAPASVISENVPEKDIKSQLTQWPVQMHLVSPMASYFQGADIVIAADCVAYSLGNFHQKYLKGKSLAIACPKLDDNQEVYLQKIQMLIDQAKVNTITVMIMEVPCCGGLLHLVQTAALQSKRKVPIKSLVVSIQGEILNEDWV